MNRTILADARDAFAARDSDAIQALLDERDALREVLGRILENEASDYKAAEEFGGYVLDDELREEARALVSRTPELSRARDQQPAAVDEAMVTMKIYVVFKDYDFEGYGVPEAVYTNDYQMHKDYPGIVNYEDENAKPFDFVYKIFEV